MKEMSNPKIGTTNPTAHASKIARPKLTSVRFILVHHYLNAVRFSGGERRGR
jgi:hypothetical protein